tara:strand:+ start:137 stop:397 length:261 start_codon:yes stop_codon:yes gene_type:complete
MRALKQLLLLLVYGFIIYCLINFLIWGLILYIIGALIVWAENIKYDETKISPLRIKFPIITALLFLPLLGIISVVNFFKYTFFVRD